MRQARENMSDGAMNFFVGEAEAYFGLNVTSRVFSPGPGGFRSSFC